MRGKKEEEKGQNELDQQSAICKQNILKKIKFLFIL